MVTEDEQIRRMKEMSRLYGQSFDMPDRFTLVLNRRNKAIQELAARDPENETTQLLCQQIYDLARMSAQPLEADEITAFLKRSQKLVAMAVGEGISETNPQFNRKRPTRGKTCAGRFLMHFDALCIFRPKLEQKSVLKFTKKRTGFSIVSF